MIDALLGDPQQVTDHDYFMESHQSLLFQIKNRGALIKPSNHVFKVISHGESILKVVLAQLGLHHPRLREALFTKFSRSALERGNVFIPTGCDVEMGLVTHSFELTKAMLTKCYNIRLRIIAGNQ